MKAFSHSDIELQVIKDVYTELLCHTHITCVCNPSASILLPDLFVLEDTRGHIRSDLLTLQFASRVAFHSFLLLEWEPISVLFSVSSPC